MVVEAVDDCASDVEVTEPGAGAGAELSLLELVTVTDGNVVVEVVTSVNAPVVEPLGLSSTPDGDVVIEVVCSMEVPVVELVI